SFVVIHPGFMRVVVLKRRISECRMSAGRGGSRAALRYATTGSIMINPKRKALVVAPIVALAVMTGSAQSPRRVTLGDWPEARGPNRDGVSRETGLIDKWALNGENFLWRAP